MKLRDPIVSCLQAGSQESRSVVFLCFFFFLFCPVVFAGRAVVPVSVQGSSPCPMERSDRLRMEISLLLSPFYCVQALSRLYETYLHWEGSLLCSLPSLVAVFLQTHCQKHPGYLSQISGNPTTQLCAHTHSCIQMGTRVHIYMHAHANTHTQTHTRWASPWLWKRTAEAMSRRELMKEKGIRTSGPFCAPNTLWEA